LKDTKEKFKPGVEKHVLLLIAGLIWIAVGSVLLGFSYFWLRDAGNNIVLWTAGSGIIISLFVHHFGFLRVVDNNLGRILPMQGKRCVFSFMTWKSYILALVMVATGILLRLSLIPRTYLSVLYIGIGAALILSSIRYLRFLISRRSKIIVTLKCRDRHKEP
jgi:hypothetical protein